MKTSHSRLKLPARRSREHCRKLSHSTRVPRRRRWRSRGDAASDGNLQAAAEHAENAERSTGVIGWFAGKTGFMKAVVLGTSLLAASCAPKGKTETYTERVSESVLPKSVDVSAYWVGKSGEIFGAT